MIHVLADITGWGVVAGVCWTLIELYVKDALR